MPGKDVTTPMPASLILVPQATGLRIEPLAGLLVQADADLAAAFEHLPRWDVAAAHLQGELVGLLRAFRAVTNLPNAVTDDEVLARARALATPTPAQMVIQSLEQLRDSATTSPNPAAHAAVLRTLTDPHGPYLLGALAGLLDTLSTSLGDVDSPHAQEASEWLDSAAGKILDGAGTEIERAADELDQITA